VCLKSTGLIILLIALMGHPKQVPLVQSRQPNIRNRNFNGTRPNNNAPRYFVPFHQIPFSPPFMSTPAMTSYPNDIIPSMQPENRNYQRYNQHWKQPGPVKYLAPIPLYPMPDLPWPAQPALEYLTSTTNPKKTDFVTLHRSSK